MPSSEVQILGLNSRSIQSEILRVEGVGGGGRPAMWVSTAFYVITMYGNVWEPTKIPYNTWCAVLTQEHPVLTPDILETPE